MNELEQCAISGCRTRVGFDIPLFVCREHWLTLPALTRRELGRSWRSWQNWPTSKAHERLNRQRAAAMRVLTAKVSRGVSTR